MKNEFESDLNKYYVEESILIKDIENNKLTLSEVRERCGKLFSLIPNNISLNPVRLENLIKEKYSNNPNYEKHTPTYIIDVGDIDENDIEEYIQNVVNKFKK